MSFIPTLAGTPSPLETKYQLLKEDYDRKLDELKQARVTIDNHNRELKRTIGELRQSNQHVGNLKQENHRLKDSINALQNDLKNVHQQQKDAKTLPDVSGPQVFSTKADILLISEVGEKVIALNEEIFQAAATLGEAIIYKIHEVPQKEWDAAVAVSQDMVGEKMTEVLITQSQKPEPVANPLLVQVVLQIFMVGFCVSKIQSWYPGDSAVEDLLSAIYSEIRSTGKHRI